MSNYSRRDVLRYGASALAGAAVLGHAAASPASAALSSTALPSTTGRTGPYRPYTGKSFFKSKVAGAPVDSARTTAFRSFMRSHPEQTYAYPRINGVGDNQWGTAFAKAGEKTPIWRLTGNVTGKATILNTTGFHAPEWLGDMFTGTNDSPFAVLDRASGFTVFGTNATVVGTRLVSVSSAGLTYHSSNGLDYRNPRSNDDRNFTSRGRVSDAMVIRKDLLNWGIENNTSLRHVLHMFLVETDSAEGFVHPMVGDESDKSGFGAEGERIAISPTVDLTKRGLSPGGLVVARTLQDYGCYIGDNSGSNSALKAEQEQPSRPGWGKLLNQDSLRGLTWDDFIVLRAGWQ